MRRRVIRRRRGFRRKRKLTWLPAIGSASIAADFPQDDFTGRQGVLVAPFNGSSDLLFAPLVIDNQIDSFGDDTTLVDVIGESYILKRTVGNIFIERQGDASGVAAEAAKEGCIYVGAGIFVARQEDTSLITAGDPDVPIGGSSLNGSVRNYGPLASTNIGEPWLWRQTWILGRGLNKFDYAAASFSGNFAASQGEGATFPVNNINYGCPEAWRIDTKVARRIRKEERLWFVIQAKGSRFGAGELALATNATAVNFHVDLRLLGALVRNSKRSVF